MKWKENKEVKYFDGYSHDLITMKGTIQAVNYKNEKIKLKITRIIDGELIKSNENWEFKSLLKFSEVKNKRNETTWEIELQPARHKEN